MLLATPLVQAHPHSFIDLHTQLLAEEQHMTGLKMRWEMDEMTSSALLYDVQAAKPGSDIWRVLADEMVENIRQSNYFTHISRDSRALNYHIAPASHSLNHHGLKVVLTFDLMLERPQPLVGSPIDIQIYEPEYYVDMAYPSEKSFEIPARLAKHCHFKLITPKPDAALLAYALSLDKQDSPAVDSQLGQRFAQTLRLTCE